MKKDKSLKQKKETKNKFVCKNCGKLIYDDTTMKAYYINTWRHVKDNKWFCYPGDFNAPLAEL